MASNQKLNVVAWLTNLSTVSKCAIPMLQKMCLRCLCCTRTPKLDTLVGVPWTAFMKSVPCSHQLDDFNQQRITIIGQNEQEDSHCSLHAQTWVNTDLWLQHILPIPSVAAIT